MKRKEPPIVAALRSQLARGASMAVLLRIAGSTADFERLDKAYGLRAPVPAAPSITRVAAPTPAEPTAEARAVVPRDRRSDDPLPERQAALLETLTELAREGLVFPGATMLAESLDCSWLVVERDLQHLQRKKLIRIAFYRDAAYRVARRIVIVGPPLLQTGLPPGKVKPMADDALEAANAVRPR